MAEKMEPGMKHAWPREEGLIPVTDGSAGDSNIIARRYLDSILVEMRILGTIEADTTFHLWGKAFSSPIMTPAFSHLNKALKDRKPMEEYAIAAKNLNLVNWVGMESDEEFKEILNTGASTIRIIKPFKDHQMILDQIHFAQENGAFAVGIDIDHSIGTNGSYDVVDGQPLGPITLDDLREFVNSTDLPFIAKGVLSLRDALICKKAGVKGVVISHHHGRMKYAVPPVMALQEIAPSLKDTDIKIFVDCHIDSGQDAYKALALGADAVSAGRVILPGLLKEGAPGVEKVIKKMNAELKEMMGYTSVKDLSSFDPSVLIHNEKHMR